MAWLESQIETRAKLDAALTERAYAELASIVNGVGGEGETFSFEGSQEVDDAVVACLRYNGVEPGTAHESVTDVDERIDWLCRPSGTMHRKVRLDENWQNHAFGPMLGSLDTGEPVALLPDAMGGYHYVEPDTGKRVRIDAKSSKHISPNAVLFYRPLPPRPLHVSDLALFILQTFDRADYLLVIAAAVISTLIGLLPPWANQLAFGVVAPSGQADLVLPIAGLLVGVTISTTLINMCRSLIMSRVSTKIDVAAEAATFSRLLGLPASFFKEYSSGDLASRASCVTAISRQLTSLLLGAGLTSVLSLVYVGQVAAYAPALAFPAFCIVIVEAVLTLLVTWLTMKFERVAMESNAKLSGTVTALLNGIAKIKLAGAEDRAFSKWAHQYARYAQAAYNRPVVVRALPAVVSLISAAGNILIYYLAGSTHVTYDHYMAFSVAFGQTTAAVMALAQMGGQIARIQPMLQMAAPIMEATPELTGNKPSVSSLTGSIEMSGVSFRYEENTPYIIKDLSLRIRPGEYVAIVGKSGCGKSTLLRLLLGFEKPERGTIFYGPYEVQKVDLRSLRSHIGVVTQDGKLFMGNLFSNITVSSPSATLDDAWEAAEIAGMADDIRRMPMGMQTMVTEGGGGISGGQRQRIMIARAVCGKKRILMLDEATSALDNLTQRHVADALETLKCTRIVVAHRLSTVRHCDRILVVDGGRIAEEGTYEELLAKNGLFAQLVARQRLETEA